MTQKSTDRKQVPGWIFLIAIVGLIAFAWWLMLNVADITGHEATATETAPTVGAPIVEVVRPKSLSDEARLGEAAYNGACAACHGTDGAGQMGVAPPFVHKIYEPGHHGDMAFQMAVQNGVRAHHWPFGNMPPVDGLTPSDVQNIVAYVRALQRENGID